MTGWSQDEDVPSPGQGHKRMDSEKSQNKGKNSTDQD